MGEWPKRFYEDHFKSGRFPSDWFRIGTILIGCLKPKRVIVFIGAFLGGNF